MPVSSIRWKTKPRKRFEWCKEMLLSWAKPARAPFPQERRVLFRACPGIVEVGLHQHKTEENYSDAYSVWCRSLPFHRASVRLPVNRASVLKAPVFLRVQRVLTHAFGEEPPPHLKADGSRRGRDR